MDKILLTFKALSDPVRLRILNLLLRGEQCVCNLVDVLDLPQSTTSRHLSILKNTGLISSRKNGLWHYYSLNPSTDFESELLAILEKNFDQETFLRDKEALAKGFSCAPGQGNNC